MHQNDLSGNNSNNNRVLTCEASTLISLTVSKRFVSIPADGVLINVMPSVTSNTSNNLKYYNATQCQCSHPSFNQTAQNCFTNQRRNKKLNTNTAVSVCSAMLYDNFNSIGSGVSQPQVAENHYLPLTRGIALTTVYALTCYTVMIIINLVLGSAHVKDTLSHTSMPNFSVNTASCASSQNMTISYKSCRMA